MAKEKDKFYYLVCAEFSYPSSNGRDVMLDIHASRKEALEQCKELCERERATFARITREEPLPPGKYKINPKKRKADGYILTSAMGMDPWWYCAKVIPVKYGI